MRKNYNIKVYTDGKKLSRELSKIFENKNFNVDVIEREKFLDQSSNDTNADIIIHDYECDTDNPISVIPDLLQKNKSEVPQIFILPNISSGLKQIFEQEYPDADYFVKPIEQNDFIHRINLLFNKHLTEKTKSGSKMTDELLYDNIDDFRSIIENLPSGAICIFDRNYNYKSVYGSGIASLGVNKDDLIQKTLSDVYPENICNYLKSQYGKVWSGKRTEFEFTHKNNLFMVSAAPIRKKDNTIDSIISITQIISVNKNAQLKVEESEELYQTIFEQSSDPILIIDNYMFVECNDATIEFLGYNTKDELNGKTPYELSPPNQPDGRSSKEKSIQIINETHKNGKARFEWMHQKRNGENVWCDVSLTKIRTNQKDRLYTIWRDITDSKNAQAALNESEKKFRSIFENSIMGIFRSTPEGKYVDVNSSFANIYGYDSPAEMIQEVQNIAELYVDPEQRKKIIQILSNQGIVENYEVKFHHKDGHTIWVLINANLNSNEKGDTIFEGTVQDITKRKIAERSLIESHAHVQALIESPKDVLIFSTDKDLRFTLFNNQYKKEVRKLWNAEIKTGGLILDYFDNPKLKKSISQSCERVLDGESFDEIKKLPENDIYYHYFWSPIIIAKGVINGVTCIAIDITTEKKIEEKLNENMEELEKFNNLMVGRELKMIDLKNEINQLREVAGLAKKYLTPKN